jgi:segregation and condensation protein B
VMLIVHDNTALLAVRPEHAGLIEAMRKEEVGKELTKASAETLAIVAYMPGISKTQMEFIRGVNVSYSLRNLQMRGLIESRGAGRAVGYHPTLELLQHYGIDSIEGLPHYTDTRSKIEQLMKQEESL